MKKLNVYESTHQSIMKIDIQKNLSVLKQLLHDTKYANLNIAGQIHNNWQFNNHVITYMLDPSHFNNDYKFIKLLKRVMTEQGFFDTDLFIKTIQNQIYTQKALNKTTPVKDLKDLQHQAKTVVGKWLRNNHGTVTDVSVFDIEDLIYQCVKTVNKL